MKLTAENLKSLEYNSSFALFGNGYLHAVHFISKDGDKAPVIRDYFRKCERTLPEFYEYVTTHEVGYDHRIFPIEEVQMPDRRRFKKDMTFEPTTGTTPTD